MKHAITLTLTAGALALTACGSSQADKAKSQVCDARADIAKQVNNLKGLELSTATVDGVSASLKAIREDLGKIKDAQGDLNAERKQQVQTANQQFGAQVTSIARNVVQSASLAAAGTQFTQATTQLESPPDCVTSAACAVAAVFDAAASAELVAV